MTFNSIQPTNEVNESDILRKKKKKKFNTKQVKMKYRINGFQPLEYFQSDTSHQRSTFCSLSWSLSNGLITEKIISFLSFLLHLLIIFNKEGL